MFCLPFPGYKLHKGRHCRTITLGKSSEVEICVQDAWVGGAPRNSRHKGLRKQGLGKEWSAVEHRSQLIPRGVLKLG